MRRTAPLPSRRFAIRRARAAQRRARARGAAGPSLQGWRTPRRRRNDAEPPCRCSLLDRAVERVLDNLAGESGSAAAGILRVGQVLGPREAAAKGQVLAVPLLGGQLQSVIRVRATGVGPDSLVEALIGPAAGGERSRAGGRQIEIGAINQVDASAAHVGGAQSE